MTKPVKMTILYIGTEFYFDRHKVAGRILDNKIYLHKWRLAAALHFVVTEKMHLKIMPVQD